TGSMSARVASGQSKKGVRNGLWLSALSWGDPMAARPSDIVIVGAGIVGCACAYELARRGASVEVVDERASGLGATQAWAGVLAPYIEATGETPLLALGVRSLELYD